MRCGEALDSVGWLDWTDPEKERFTRLDCPGEANGRSESKRDDASGLQGEGGIRTIVVVSKLPMFHEDETEKAVCEKRHLSDRRLWEK